MAHAVIMAGGKGTRLQNISKDIPKPMFPVNGKPILEYQIESLKKSGIDQIILVVGHLGELIREHFQDGNKFGVRIEYIVEKTPLGTAGALFYLREQLQEDFLLLFGDLMLDVDWNRFLNYHKEREALITLYGHPNSHPYDSDVIVVDGRGKVIRIERKNVERDFYYHNFVNAGIYCMSPKVLERIERAEKLDLEKVIIASQIPQGVIYAYRSTEYVKDMGTPERLSSVSRDVEVGIVKSRSLQNRQKAVFLDRDGTINEYVGFLTDINQFSLIDGVTTAVKKINSSEYLCIVATNQPVIARGEVTMDELNNIHMKMETELGKEGAYIDDLFFCPHHPHRGYDGEVEELKIKCNCRKPDIGMLIEAAHKYNIDLEESWYIGDTTVDIQTGKNAGMRTILVLTGMGGKDCKYDVNADYVAKNLNEAIDIILGD